MGDDSRNLLGGDHRRRASGHGGLLGGLAGASTEEEGDEAKGDDFDELHGFGLLVCFGW